MPRLGCSSYAARGRTGGAVRWLDPWGLTPYGCVPPPPPGYDRRFRPTLRVGGTSGQGPDRVRSRPCSAVLVGASWLEGPSGDRRGLLGLLVSAGRAGPGTRMGRILVTSSPLVSCPIVERVVSLSLTANFAFLRVQPGSLQRAESPRAG